MLSRRLLQEAWWVAPLELLQLAHDAVDLVIEPTLSLGRAFAGGPLGRFDLGSTRLMGLAGSDIGVAIRGRL